ncbi:hypothetical protein [Dysgonomonas sp. 25]|uniref:hypothetical protein n=1 Tax=Dysgonomonas sp. 25 TaxID=2302933 RepID=UPI0013D642C5|nr:hypothetical protein [Dysgonomonas sp. 25]NDV69596.1 hypothetical protein [Dysgonomonas sp. 25]
MIEMLKDKKSIKISNIDTFRKIELPIEPELIETLFITGSFIDDFSFLERMREIKKLVFLACKSDIWEELKGNISIKILRLHNIKRGKFYLNNIDFINTFPSLEYLYINMLGITEFPDIVKLERLHTICSSNRNLVDFSTLEYVPNLQTFIGWAAVDKHRTPAEAFIPILKNTKLKAFNYSQMFNVEKKKLKKYVDLYCPNILYPMSTFEGIVVDNRKVMDIIKLFF